jgi:hypothetical protein
MTEFWGLVLFGTVAAIIISVVLTILYCGRAVICSKLRRPEPLAENAI